MSFFRILSNWPRASPIQQKQVKTEVYAVVPRSWRKKKLVLRPTEDGGWVLSTADSQGSVLYNPEDNTFTYTNAHYSTYMRSDCTFTTAFTTSTAGNCRLTATFVKQTGVYTVIFMKANTPFDGTVVTSQVVQLNSKCTFDRCISFCRKSQYEELTEEQGMVGVREQFSSYIDREQTDRWYNGEWVEMEEWGLADYKSDYSIDTVGFDPQFFDQFTSTWKTLVAE